MDGVSYEYAVSILFRHEVMNLPTNYCSAFLSRVDPEHTLELYY